MAHAEECPVCKGSGVITPFNDYAQTVVPPSKACHGCGGRGWIEVRDDFEQFKADLSTRIDKKLSELEAGKT